MKNLNIEIFDKKTVRLQTRPSGDLEIVISELRKETRDIHTSKVQNPGGVHDEILAVIPQNRRDLVADFIKNA